METEALIVKPQSNASHRLLPAVLPVLFIAISYIDPGKWVAAVEGGAHFGYDLVILMFVFSLAAVLCQYLSACITVVTGRDLAQICSSECDTVTCILLGIQTELSMIALDLSMILGTAHGLNLLFGMSLFTCVLLTSLDALLFPLFSNLLETDKTKFTCGCLASLALLSYIFGVLASKPDTSLSTSGGMLIRLSGESVFALISLLGASIMPHNFYLHSSIVQQTQGPNAVPKGALCLDHLFAISTVFSAIFIINYVLMNSAANVFYNTGLYLLTLQDALSLTDHTFRSLIGTSALTLILLISNHTTALTWEFTNQTILKNLFKINIPAQFHHSTIRSIAIIPALFCSWHSGAEGTYHLLMLNQLVAALLLPSSVIPVFRIATSGSVMGMNKVSRVFEFGALITFIGMLGLSVMFIIELVFGNSDWASNIRWNTGAYSVILVTACGSLFLMLWLVVTPLKSATEDDRIEESVEFDSDSSNINLPEGILESETGHRLTTVDESSSENLIISPPEELSPKMKDLVTGDGPGSFRNVAGKKEDAGSLTRLAGLGRPARRQLAAVLDEFWGQLFDFHGEPTQEAKIRKLDRLLGIESKTIPNPNPASMSSTQMRLLDAYARQPDLNVMDCSEKRYHSLRLQSSSGGLRMPHAFGGYSDQPATVHGYQIKSYMSLGSSNYKAPSSLTRGTHNGTSPAKPPGFPDPMVSRNNSINPEKNYYSHLAETMHSTVNEKKYYSMPDISGLSLGQKRHGLSVYPGASYVSRSSSGYVGAHQLSSGLDTRFGVAEKLNNSMLNLNSKETGAWADLEANLLKSLRLCIVKLLKLEGSDWLFQQNSGLDEDLVDRVAAREQFLFEVESKEMHGAAQVGDPRMKIDLVTSIPNCGEGCVWRADLVTSFGVWCTHRVLELSLMESRPELWGKYTYVLNRLQGIIELAFSKPRAAMNPCFCLQLPTSYHQRRESPPKSATSLPPQAKQSKGKCTTAASLLDIVKDVEIAISCRKGRTGTAAGDVAFPKGKENLASVLKRYKRRLSNNPAVTPNASNKSPSYGL